MFRIVIGEKTYAVSFKHLHNSDAQKKDAEQIENPGTLCLIREINADSTPENPGPVVAYGKSNLVGCDNYCRATGRKIALTNAFLVKGDDGKGRVYDPATHMPLYVFSKFIRSMFWHAYFETIEESRARAKADGLPKPTPDPINPVEIVTLPTAAGGSDNG